MSRIIQALDRIKYSVFLDGKHLGDVLAIDLDDAFAEAESEYGENLEYEIHPSEGGY